MSRLSLLAQFARQHGLRAIAKRGALYVARTIDYADGLTVTEWVECHSVRDLRGV